MTPTEPDISFGGRVLSCELTRVQTHWTILEAELNPSSEQTDPRRDSPKHGGIARTQN